MNWSFICGKSRYSVRLWLARHHTQNAFPGKLWNLLPVLMPNTLDSTPIHCNGQDTYSHHFQPVILLFPNMLSYSQKLIIIKYYWFQTRIKFRSWKKAFLRLEKAPSLLPQKEGAGISPGFQASPPPPHGSALPQQLCPRAPREGSATFPAKHLNGPGRSPAAAPAPAPRGSSGADTASRGAEPGEGLLGTPRPGLGELQPAASARETELGLGAAETGHSVWANRYSLWSYRLWQRYLILGKEKAETAYQGRAVTLGAGQEACLPTSPSCVSPRFLRARVPAYHIKVQRCIIGAFIW